MIPTILSSLLTAQWCAANAGIFRYAVWMIPVMAYVGASCLKHTKTLRTCILVALFFQLSLMNDLPSWLEWRGMSRFVLEKAPRLYYAEPEIFVDYSLKHDTMEGQWRNHLPVAFFNSRGEATKILVTQQTIGLLPRRFQVEPAYLKQILQQYKKRRGWFYLHPPSGTIKALKIKSEPQVLMR